MTRILVIDDDAGVLMGLPELLRLHMRGLEVEACGSPSFGLNLINANDYDAIISDINMPGLDGLSLLAKIKMVRPGTPVLLMTASDDRAIIIQALRGGAYDFIQKPIDIEYFVASLQRAIQMRELSRQVETQKIALERHAEGLERNVKTAVAEAEAAQRRLAFLAEVSTLLASSLDYEATLGRLARLAVLYMADYCIVDMVESTADDQPELRCLATAHVNRSQEGLLRQWRAFFQGQHRLLYPGLSVLKSGRAELHQTIPDAGAWANIQDPEQMAISRELKPRSSIIVPIVVQEQILGLVTFTLSNSLRQYGPDDLTLADDLTRRAALAVRNAQLYTQTQQALAGRDQFLAIAAHELKTPITSIIGMAQLLQRDLKPLSQEVTRINRRMQVLIDQARRLNRLLDSLLNLSRLDAGQLTLEREALDISELAQRVTNELRLAVDTHQIEYSGPSDPVIVIGDELRLEQVLQNLVHNSIKYSPDGGKIKVELKQETQRAWLKVADEGIGIAPNALPRLFERYYRVENPLSRQTAGIGLGLYVVREIITLHGGTIEVVSQEGQGSVFTIQLPVEVLTEVTSVKA